jgi:hypothetical protein
MPLQADGITVTGQAGSRSYAALTGRQIPITPGGSTLRAGLPGQPAVRKFLEPAVGFLLELIGVSAGGSDR